MSHKGSLARIKYLFLDCDDCLYNNGWKTAGRLTKKIGQHCVDKLGLEEGQAYRLYKQYGTCLKGLVEEGIIEDSEEAVDECLESFHDVPLDDIHEDKPLQELISSVDPSVKKWVFTASVASHARRCLGRLGISPDKHFEGIIDVRAVGNITKHDPEAFKRAMAIAGVTDPTTCLFADDSSKNIRTAKDMGWMTVLVGPERDGNKEPAGNRKCKEADWQISRIHELPKVCPQLFVNDGGESKSTESELMGGSYHSLPTVPFQVVPVRDCPHCLDGDRHLGKIPADFSCAASVCSVCGHSDENYVCCKCFRVCCGRHVQGHMLEHSKASDHAIALGVLDLSVWCFGCDAYLDVFNIPELRNLYCRAHMEKFGEPPPDGVFEQVTAANGAPSFTITLQLGSAQSLTGGEAGMGGDRESDAGMMGKQ